MHGAIVWHCLCLLFSCIAVGDGFTDYQLFEAGFVDKFIAYTEHVERASVVEKAECIAIDVGVLRYILK